jgi:hypothetical protein
MTDASQTPVFDDDPQLDSTLRSVARFSPRQGFEDRVVGRVLVPLPRFLRRLRDSWRATVSGVTGWTLLATFSLATAAAWGTAIAAGVRYAPDVRYAVPWTSGEFRQLLAEGLRESYATQVAAEWASAIQLQIAGAGLPLRALLAGYGMLVIVSAVALWRLMAEPARAKGTINVVR